MFTQKWTMNNVMRIRRPSLNCAMQWNVKYLSTDLCFRSDAFTCVWLEVNGTKSFVRLWLKSWSRGSPLQCPSRRVKGVVEDIQGKEADCHLDAEIKNMMSHHWTTAENNVIRGCDKLTPWKALSIFLKFPTLSPFVVLFSHSSFLFSLCHSVSVFIVVATSNIFASVSQK